MIVGLRDPRSPATAKRTPAHPRGPFPAAFRPHHHGTSKRLPLMDETELRQRRQRDDGWQRGLDGRAGPLHGMRDVGTLFAAARLRECFPCTGERGGGVARYRDLIPQGRLSLLLGVQGESFSCGATAGRSSNFVAA